METRSRKRAEASSSAPSSSPTATVGPTTRSSKRSRLSSSTSAPPAPTTRSRTRSSSTATATASPMDESSSRGTSRRTRSHHNSDKDNDKGKEKEHEPPSRPPRDLGLNIDGGSNNNNNNPNNSNAGDDDDNDSEGGVGLLHQNLTSASSALQGLLRKLGAGLDDLLPSSAIGSVDFVPTVAGVSLAEAPAFAKAPGGAPANVAVGVSRLGGSSAFIGKVGKDEFGFMLADILKKDNVDNSGMRFDPTARTALAFVTLRADGEREFLFFRNPSADMLLHESELDRSLLEKARIFHYGSISLIEEPCRSAHLAAMKIVKKAGGFLSYDPNLRKQLWPSEEAAKNGIMSIWNEADMIKVSEDEITFLTGGEDPYDDKVVMKLFHPNLKLLIVTEGSEGCRYYTKNFKGRVAGVKVKPVDTTGAGDAFVGGILSSLASDLSLYKDETRLREALRFANACGAVTVTKRGAIPGLPTREEVLKILQQSG